MSTKLNEFLGTYSVNFTNNIQILRGKRDGAPQFLNTAY
jgi:hypothetical protein